jgi:transcriptional regulator with XRE-family HTH domain
MELAERAEISVTYLGAIERRERWPHPDILSRLANALAVEVRDIFTPENAVTQDMNIIVERLKQDMAGLLESASLEMLGKAAGGATKPKK